jgi:dihydrodipicolinate synthase/N-acetylneuraminate lyase
MRTQSGFFGIYPMVYALFDNHGKLSREAMRKQVAAMLKHGVHGIAVLGLASEVNKLSTAERRTLMEWVAEDIDGTVPLAVTVAEVSAAGQIEFVQAATAVGAKWVILQPPPASGVPESELIRFFGAVADQSSLPVGIQNAPEYLGVGLSNAGLKALNKAHPNVRIVKLEATAVAVQRLLEELEGAVDVFNGRAGVEMTDSIRAGAAGIIPGGETFDLQVKIFEQLVSGQSSAVAAADRQYAELLPLLVFLMHSIDDLVVYGKQVLRHRLGIGETVLRMPYTPPTAFGLETAQRYARALGTL